MPTPETLISLRAAAFLTGILSGTSNRCAMSRAGARLPGVPAAGAPVQAPAARSERARV